MKFVRTAQRYRTVSIQAGSQTITAGRPGRNPRSRAHKFDGSQALDMDPDQAHR